MRTVSIITLKLTLIAVIFYYLISRALHSGAFAELNVGAFRWDYLTLGLVLNLVATVITIIRWRALVLALHEPLSMTDALKFGFIGFMFNLSPVGIVGGDAIKVVLLSKKSGASVSRSTASVVIDRAVGLYAMFVLGVLFLFITGFSSNPSSLARFATRGLIGLTFLTTLFFILVVSPSRLTSPLVSLLRRLPVVGAVVEKLTTATLEYSRSRLTLFYSFLATLLVHSFFSASLFCLARGLYRSTPSLIDHFTLYCLGNVGSIIPLSAGPLEYFLDELYPLFPVVSGEIEIEPGYGMTVGIAYRLATVAVALIGVLFYVFSRNEVRASDQTTNEK